MALYRLHVYRSARRTTVSIDQVLADLLMLARWGELDMRALTEWCQAEIDKDPGAYDMDASQRLSGKAALEIAPKKLQEVYWALQQASTGRARATSRHGRRATSRR